MTETKIHDAAHVGKSKDALKFEYLTTLAAARALVDAIEAMTNRVERYREEAERLQAEIDALDRQAKRPH